MCGVSNVRVCCECYGCVCICAVGVCLVYVSVVCVEVFCVWRVCVFSVVWVCLRVISELTERCRLIFCNIYILVYVIGNKKNCAVPYDSCVFIFGRVRVFLVFDSRL